MKYDFDTVIERRGTSSLKWDFDGRFCGRGGQLPLWVADMDFAAPPEIQRALEERVAHPVYGYTLEPESYFEAARAWLHRRHGWDVPREWMRASPGVIPSLSAAILALTEPGDGIVIQPPVYHPFAHRIVDNGRRVVANPLRLTGTRWEMDLDALEEAVDARTRMFVLCSPHNPVSRVWDRPTLERLAVTCARHGIVVVSDEIHCDLLMPGVRHLPVCTLSEDAAQNTITLVAATKTFNLAGLGGSIAIIPAEGLRGRFDAEQHAIFAGIASAPAVAAAEAAWRHGDQWLDQLLGYIAENYRFTVGFLAARLPQVKAFPLEGTYLAWLDVRALGLGDAEVKDRLLQACVWLDEGVKFGREGRGFQRLNLACPRSILAEGLERMTAALGGG